MKIITQFIKKHKGLTTLTIIVLSFQVFGTLYVPFLVARLINEGVTTGDIQKVTYIGIQMLIFTVVTGLVSTWGSHLTAKLSAMFSYETTDRVFGAVQRLSISDVNQFGIASLQTRTISDVENISWVIVLFMQMIVPAPIMSIASIFMTVTVSPDLIWIPLVIIAIFLVVVSVLMFFGNKYSRIVQEKMDNIMRSVREFYTGIRVIRAFDNESLEKAKTDASFKDYANNMIILNKIFAWMTPTVNVLMSGAMIAILWFGALEVSNGQMAVGSVTAVVQYVMLTLLYLVTAAMVLITLPNALASIYRIQEVLDYQPEVIDDYALVNNVSQSTDMPVLEFNQVTFTYPDAEAPVLNDINFALKQGQTLAIVGSTGSGKSTIAKLLLRFNDVTAGNIRFKGRDIRKLTQEVLRTHISYIPQKAFLFSGTVWDNLIYGKSDATIDEVNKATRIAQAADFITKLMDSYQSRVVQGGVNFSGGQRQRLSIARALVKPADVYVFDDSFSALDYKTDALIRQALKEEMRESTMIIVAQRLSTITDADYILVLNDGKIEGFGQHSDLLSNNTYYRSMAISQQLIGEDI